jgi:hypothetical protein
LQLYLGDELDLIKGVSPRNEAFLDVSRLVLRDVHLIKPEDDEDGEGGFRVKLRKLKAVTIENYPEDPWKQ